MFYQSRRHVLRFVAAFIALFDLTACDINAVPRQDEAALAGALGRLLAVSESYPRLKSDQNFLSLQSQLEGTENRVAVAPRDYIEAVQSYNTTLRTIPSR